MEQKPGSRVFYWLLLATLVPWVFASYVSLFAFDAPGSQNDPAIWRVVVPIWCYPLLAGLCALVGFAFRKTGAGKAERVVLCIPLAVVAFGACLLGSAVFKELQSAKNSENVGYANENLDAIPSDVFIRKIPIDSLDFKGNRLTQLPPDIANLRKLRYLNLSGNQLTSLPPEIGQLTELKELKLSGNQLQDLPPEFAKLVNLKLLWLDGNPLVFPKVLTQLKGLEILDLSVSSFTSLPAEIGGMTGLKELRIRRGKLTSLPAELGNLKNLKVVDLDSNQLTTLPAELATLPLLDGLYVRDNPLGALPPEISRLPALHK